MRTTLQFYFLRDSNGHFQCVEEKTDKCEPMPIVLANYTTEERNEMRTAFTEKIKEIRKSLPTCE